MKKRIVIVDTSILVVWLNVPGFEEAGTEHLKFAEIDNRIQTELNLGTSLLLTVATIIETGNHIAQIKTEEVRRQKVTQFADFLAKASEAAAGWMVYFQENGFWNREELLKLTDQWREQGIYRLSMGDASILKVANSLKPLFDVEVYTGDTQLNALSQIPVQPVYAPRKKRN